MDMPPEMSKYWEKKLLESIEKTDLWHNYYPVKAMTKRQKLKQRIIDICERIIEWASK